MCSVFLSLAPRFHRLIDPPGASPYYFCLYPFVPFPPCTSLFITCLSSPSSLLPSLPPSLTPSHPHSLPPSLPPSLPQSLKSTHSKACRPTYSKAHTRIDTPEHTNIHVVGEHASGVCVNMIAPWCMMLGDPERAHLSSLL